MSQLFVLSDDQQALDAPAVVVLEMPPNYVLFRHAHVCHRFEVVVKGSLEAGGRIRHTRGPRGSKLWFLRLVVNVTETVSPAPVPS